MTFITEEIWHMIKDRSDKDCIIAAEWPATKSFNSLRLTEFSVVGEIINSIRGVRKQKNISPKDALSLTIKVTSGNSNKAWDSLICRLYNLPGLIYSDDKPSTSVSFVVKH